MYPSLSVCKASLLVQQSQDEEQKDESCKNLIEANLSQIE
jgi:hypothetical protein